jgi:uncharacterized protein DUF6285
MRVEPSAAELLRLAREQLLEELLPQLPESSRYAARMAANAMAIAARELDGAGADPEQELARLRSLLPEWEPEQTARDGAVREGTTLLAAAIRAGRFDSPEAHKRLAEHLRKTTEERLAVSNPRILVGQGASGIEQRPVSKT